MDAKYAEKVKYTSKYYSDPTKMLITLRSHQFLIGHFSLILLHSGFLLNANNNRPYYFTYLSYVKFFFLSLLYVFSHVHTVHKRCLSLFLRQTYLRVRNKNCLSQLIRRSGNSNLIFYYI